MPIYSVGHSNVGIEKFLDLLRARQIDLLVDARSSPYSRFNPHFSRESLRLSIMESGIRYVYLGNLIGGKPADRSLHREDGSVDYDLVIESRPFNAGLDQLIELGREKKVAVMCAEADFKKCHRYWLITRALKLRGIEVRHLLHSGEIAPTDPDDFSPRQGSLF